MAKIMMPALMLLVIGIASAQAQLPANLCPPPGRWVPGGGGMMCQCPDGSFYGLGRPCGSGAQQRPQMQPQQNFQQRRSWVRREHERRAKAPAFNKVTRQWEQRQGQTARASNGRQVWYHPPIYQGPAFVFLYDVGYVEMDDRYDSIIYPDLDSGDPDRILEAVNLIEGSAMMQGLLDMGESDGD